MKKMVVLVVLAVAICLSGFSLLAAPAGLTRTITDRAGYEVTIPLVVNRIVSTAPSNTEILIGLGLASNIVCVDNYSPTEDLPQDVAVINFALPDIEAIIGLEPDIIIASGHNKRTESDDPFALLAEFGIPVVYLPSASSISGILEDIEFLGNITNRSYQASRMVTNFQNKLDQITTLASTITEPRKVYLEIGNYDGILYSAGNNTFLDDILTIIGAINIFGNQDLWIRAPAEDIVISNPDVIISTNSHASGTRAEILGREGFAYVRAIRNGAVYVVDGNRVSRGSQHIIGGIWEIATSVYPEVFHFEE